MTISAGSCAVRVASWVALASLAACTNAVDEAAPTDGSVTGGVIIDPNLPTVGDGAEGPATLDAETTDVDTTAPPAAPTSAPVAPPTTTTSTTSSATTPATAPATVAVPPDTGAVVIGDGPTLTAPIGDGVSENPGAESDLVPAFFALEASVRVGCETADVGTVDLRWEVIGAESVDIAVGSASAMYRMAQPPAAVLEVPLDCTTGTSYFVVAANPEGSVTRSVTVDI